MSKINELWKAFSASKNDAKACFKTCELFCNFLPDAIETDLRCQQDCQRAIATERPEKQNILVM